MSFAGFVLNEEGHRPDPANVTGIKQFPTLTNLTDLRSFIGLVNQMTSFSSDIVAPAEKLRPLLRVKNSFLWNEMLQAAFGEVKSMLSSTPTLAYYDPTLPTSIHSDGSKTNGLGFVLKQKQDGSWRMVRAGSRFLTDTES